jgi:tetratricopeptide (TPR) repeat protein
VAQALLDKGDCLARVGRTDEAVAAYDEVVARFGVTDERPLRDRVVRALADKGLALADEGRTDEAAAAYDEVLTRFAGSREPSLRDPVAWALLSKGRTLGRMGRTEEAVAAYDQVLELPSQAPESPSLLGDHAALALVRKSYQLARVGAVDGAAQASQELLRRFGASAPAALGAWASEELSNWGMALDLAAQNADSSQKQHLLAEAEARYAEAEARLPGVTFYDRACVAALGGDHDACLRYLDASREAGRLLPKDHVESDPDLASVRDTEWFREFLQRAYPE